MSIFKRAVKTNSGPPKVAAASSPAGQSRLEMKLGLLLATLWGFHAAAYGYPGRAYFYVTSLNDSSKPLNVNVMLHPAFLFAALFLAFRLKSKRVQLRGTSRCGVAIGLGCWLLGATMSMVFNTVADQVLLTYFSVFLAGVALYAALDGIRLTPRTLELGILGLVVGSMFPLIGGVLAFRQEWGIADPDTIISAYQNLARMGLYEAATFGSRGNTAAFLMIVCPLFLFVALDKTRTRWIRAICAAVMVPIVFNLLVLEIRAAFLTLVLSCAAIFGFKLGFRRYPLFLAGLAVALLLAFRYSPDITLTMFDRLRPIVTADMVEDRSVMERAESIEEGLVTAERNWQVGIGPGGAVTRHSLGAAHQFQIQQFMETGILGLLGSTVFAFGVLLMLGRSLARSRDDEANNIRFSLLIGPASFVMYGLLSNATLAVGYVNTWTVLMASMLALTPPLEAKRVALKSFARQLRPTTRTVSAPSVGSWKTGLQVD